MTLKVKPSLSFSLQVSYTKYYLLKTIHIKIPQVFSFFPTTPLDP